MNALTTVDPSIAAFAASVREALDDLTPDEIDDLTDGLEADLSDQAADDDAPPLGDAAAYADELRAAAGLPPRGSTAAPTTTQLLRQNLRQMRDDTARAIRSHPFLAATSDLLASMRPIWWAARGVLLFGLLALGWLSSSGERIPDGIWIVLLAAVVVSVQWGRGRWLPRRGLRIIPLIASVVAVLAIVPVYTTMLMYTSRQFAEVYAYESYRPEGLVKDGEQITNIFAYDADGRPLTEVQLFDQNGDPLTTIYTSAAQADLFEVVENDELVYALLRRDSAPKVGGWNVYPLVGAELDDSGVVGDARPIPFPFTQVDPLLKIVTEEPSEMSPTNVPGR